MRPSYIGVFLTFARNSLIRDMTFRANFLLQCASSLSWTLMNLGFYLIVFQHTPSIGAQTGWGRYEFFVFLGTTWIATSIVQAFFMPNMDEFSELIRTGDLDFTLLKPIDTQFLVSLRKVEWSNLSNFLMGVTVLGVALNELTRRPEHPVTIGPVTVALYLGYLACGIVIFYSLMVALTATSVWLGRNQSLYDFWFYITSFARYPMEIYRRGWGVPLWFVFTYIIPVLVVINVPARILAQPLRPEASISRPLALFTVLAAAASLLAARIVFQRALVSYRSASS